METKTNLQKAFQTVGLFMIGQVHKQITDVFTVLNAKNEPVLGIDPGDFMVSIFNPNGEKTKIQVDIIELGEGHYRVCFILNCIGQWFVVISHIQYFPWGKAATYQICQEDLESMATTINFIRDIEGGRWQIDPAKNEMLFYKDDNQTLVARFKLYDETGNPSSQNVFDRRRI